MENITINGYKLVEYWDPETFEKGYLKEKDSIYYENDIINNGYKVETENYEVCYTKYENPKIIILIVKNKDSNEQPCNIKECWTEEVVEGIKKHMNR